MQAAFARNEDANVASICTTLAELNLGALEGERLLVWIAGLSAGLRGGNVDDLLEIFLAAALAGATLAD